MDWVPRVLAEKYVPVTFITSFFFFNRESKCKWWRGAEGEGERIPRILHAFYSMTRDHDLSQNQESLNLHDSFEKSCSLLLPSSLYEWGNRGLNREITYLTHGSSNEGRLPESQAKWLWCTPSHLLLLGCWVVIQLHGSSSSAPSLVHAPLENQAHIFSDGTQELCDLGPVTPTSQTFIYQAIKWVRRVIIAISQDCFNDLDTLTYAHIFQTGKHWTRMWEGVLENCFTVLRETEVQMGYLPDGIFHSVIRLLYLVHNCHS